MQYCGNHARFDIILLLAFFEMSPQTLVLIAFVIYFAATLLELHLTFEICCPGLSLYIQRDLWDLLLGTLFIYHTLASSSSLCIIFSFSSLSLVICYSSYSRVALRFILLRWWPFNRSWLFYPHYKLTFLVPMLLWQVCLAQFLCCNARICLAEFCCCCCSYPPRVPSGTWGFRNGPPLLPIFSLPSSCFEREATLLQFFFHCSSPGNPWSDSATLPLGRPSQCNPLHSVCFNP